MKRKKSLSIFVLALMNVAIIMSLRGLPLMAKEGLSLIFYLLFSLCVFLIPSALVSAELATGWPEKGGIFFWVSKAFGYRAGFTAIWLQWLQNVFWYPTVLSFAAGALSYLFLTPELAQSPLYNMIVILCIYWGATIINLKGIEATGKLSSFCVSIGTIFPAFLIILLGIFWWMQGNPLESFSSEHVFPDFSSFSNVAFLAGIVLLFAGMEVNAVHAKEIKNPTFTYPKAILLSVVIIFGVFFLGSMSIALVLPQDQITLTAGVMQAFAKFLQQYNASWAIPVMGLLLSFGAIGGVSAWIVGPSKGLLATAEKGFLPTYLSYTNKAEVPSHILLIQGIIVTILSSLYIVMPTVNSAFFILSDLTVMLYLTMYLLMFSSAIYLRYSEPAHLRAYKIPGGNYGMWIVASLGIIGSLFAIFVGFFPPSQLSIFNPKFYVGFLVAGLLISLIVPQWIFSNTKGRRKSSR